MDGSWWGFGDPTLPASSSDPCGGDSNGDPSNGRAGLLPLGSTFSYSSRPSTLQLSYNSGNFTIDAYSGGASNFFDGYMDEVAIYPTTLSGAQVAAHYAAAQP